MTGAEALRQGERRHLRVIIFAERMVVDDTPNCAVTRSTELASPPTLT